MRNDASHPYWRTPGERAEQRAHGDEFSALDRPADLSRRDFLKAAGFTMFAAGLAGCRRAPAEKIVPHLKSPDGPVPGSASYYASACGACEAGCGILVKALDGRPIKVEGLPDHPLSKGGLCAAGQAALLGLYDARRFSGPLLGGEPTSWETVDSAMKERLGEWRRAGSTVRFLTRTMPSPTAIAVLDRFVGSIPGARRIVYDPLSCSAIVDAHERTHGVRVLPRYRFEGARVIVGFEADFLGSWISPVEHAAGYAAGRRLAGFSSSAIWHEQWEACVTLTGSNADSRRRVAPGEARRALAYLARLLAERTGEPFPSVEKPGGAGLEETAERLWEARGRGLVLCGERDVAAQVLCNYVNEVLGNYGNTLDLRAPSRQKLGDDRALADLAAELESGRVSGLFLAGANPAHELHGFDRLIDKAEFVVAFALRADETTELADLVCAEDHDFETWSDVEPVEGSIGIRQPTILPRGRTRSMIESISVWLGDPRSAHDLVRDHWRERIWPRRPEGDGFEEFWTRAVHDGFALVTPESVDPAPFARDRVERAAADPSFSARAEGTLTLVGYAKAGMGDGRHGYNPWLQELPDPVSKVTWDNYACLSVSRATTLGVSEGDLVSIEANGSTVEIPVHIQPGQHEDVVAVALGYGQRTTERFSDIGPKWFRREPTLGPGGVVGVNIVPLLGSSDVYRRPVVEGVRLRRTGRRRDLASTQSHHYITVPEKLAPANGRVRPCIQETTLEEYRADPGSGIHKHHLPDDDLYPADHTYPGRHWAMVIDLSLCNGCSACVVACQAENNVPVVGRDEVRRKREMHWLRIDRYYKGDADEVTVAHQPMLCQHCENAPCEAVCPVLATVHTEEGLNAQAYNRCVGTRYCANNCPYKVRRFNWFDYRRDDPVENLVLNPTVTIRSRGVMEKCSFCVQRIQEATIAARSAGRLPADGEIRTACQQSCPAQAIAFGDRNDPESAVHRAMRDPRHYLVLEELNVRPSVGYLTVVRDRDSGRDATGKEKPHHG